ncbi:N-acetylmuramic acid 6-phosphate etherase [Robiginitomaculum antarcticum]|uniref:N-acetylmuramic acid 6-phosphate etherase n=1 Tax=Robiginitomaculum antarcticum TaxID=437507 RepID=UPI00039BC3F5|nr:N-acetylmuramic acid 6-phosphate etherase [Robiginitomaculum antarcticum]
MTEEISRKYTNLDIWPVRDIVDAMYDGQIEAIKAVSPALDKIAEAAEAAARKLGESGRLIYVGAGTSGRLAVLDGSELGPTFGWPHDRTEFCMAGGKEALMRSQEGAEDIAEDGQSALQNINAGSEDVVICVSASGRTPFTLGALKEAKARGAMTIGVANNSGTPILAEANYSILAETGSEIIAGSTRMKAGTAQKVILNMLSTAIMTRLGRVHDGLMVDMIVSNAKLEIRAANIVSQIAQCSPDLARSALRDTHNNIKKAVLVCTGANVYDSEAILQKVGGNLRQGLAHLQNRDS